MLYTPVQARNDKPQDTGLPSSKQFNFRDFVTNLKYSLIPGRPLSRAIGTQTIGTTQVSIPHKLGKMPNVVIITMTSAGQVYQSQAADATNIYLKADAASRTCNVQVLNITDTLR